ncbi:MAG: cation:proton antiporter [Propionibacteriaceae bacterium]|nr:cation:proton antiporter [Propionibacteriaceae bacterium]
MEHYLVLAVIGIAAIVALTTAGSKLGIAPPLILILVGLAISFVPVAGQLDLPGDAIGEVILIGVLPPLLYSSAVSVPVVEFRRDLVAVGALAVVLVVVTALGLGALLHLFLPAEVPFTLCVALGAIISPTDAVATAIVKRLGVPSRVVTLLDGESLLNDATALVLLRATTAAVALGADVDFSFTDVAWDFAQSAVLATVVGAIVGFLAIRVRQHVHQAAANTAVSLIVPFVAYVPSEELGASGLVAVVVAGLVSNQLAPHRLTARDRMNEDANWHTVEYLLEGAVFLLMGLQLKTLLTDPHVQGRHLLAVGLGLLCIVGAVVVRGAFVTVLGLMLRRATRRKVQRKERLETVGDALGVDFQNPGTWSSADLEAVRLAGPPRLGPGLEGLSEQRRRALDALARRTGQAVDPVSVEGVSADGVVADCVTGDAAQERQWREERWAEWVQANPRVAAQRQRRFDAMKTGLARYMADVDYLLREPMGVQEGALLVWAGMRGVVTLAAAQTLAPGTPARELLILIAFVVAVGSMLLQGGTLGAVAKLLKLAGRDNVPAGDREALDHALGEAALAALLDEDLCRRDGTPYDDKILALATLRLGVTRLADQPDGAASADGDGGDDGAVACGPVGEARAVMEEARRRLVGAPEDGDDLEEAALDTADRKRQHRELRLVMIHAMREALLEARALGTYCHKTLDDALAVLDADEVGLELRARTTD